jgi:hypothetical protein
VIQVLRSDLCSSPLAGMIGGRGCIVKYWVYEHWAAEKKAVVHVESCGYCNNGYGCHRNGSLCQDISSSVLSTGLLSSTMNGVVPSDSGRSRCDQQLKIGRLILPSRPWTVIFELSIFLNQLTASLMYAPRTI